jgi:hypothetical protein
LLDRNKVDNGIVGHRVKQVDNMIVGHKLGDNVRTKKKHTLCRGPSDEHSSKVRLVNQLQRRFKCDKFTDKAGDKDGPRKVMTISHMITPSGKLNIHETTEHSLLNR